MGLQYKFRGVNMLEEDLEEKKNRLANNIVDLMVDDEIKKFMQSYNGWICGFGMDKRIEKSKRKFRRFPLEELELLNDIYYNKANGTLHRNILNKHPYTEEEVLEILKKARVNMPLIFFHKYISYDS